MAVDSSIPAHLIAQFAAQQLLYRAALHLDAGDWEAFASCFTVDGVLARPSDPDNPFVGRDAIRASVEARPPQRTMHLVTNTVFTDVSSASMTAISRVLKLSGPVDGPAPATADPVMPAGTFVDRLALVDDQWLIADRQGSIGLKAAWS